jgi:hypothetical protein
MKLFFAVGMFTMLYTVFHFWQQASGTCYSDITMCAYLSQHKEMTTTTEQLTD